MGLLIECRGLRAVRFENEHELHGTICAIVGKLRIGQIDLRHCEMMTFPNMHI